MKRINYILPFIILLLAGVSSCKKGFLDVPDKSVILQQAYVTDLKSTGHFLNGVYVQMALRFYMASYGVYPDIIADNIKPSSSGFSLIAQYTWSQQASRESTIRLDEYGLNANGVWFTGYGLIRNCNFVIETIDQYRDQDAAKADDIKGQAYALRALLHFELSNVFSQPFLFTADGSHAGIPYITFSDWRQPVTRQKASEVYAGMISDLTTAIGLLPASPLTVSGDKKNFNMNRNAAKALLAKIYLFKGDYQPAKNLAREVATAVPLTVGADYPSSLFTGQETEALLQLPPSGHENGYATFYSGGFMRSYKEFVATDDIAGLLAENPNDIRNSWIDNSSGENDIVKFPTGITGAVSFADADYYHTLLRSSEMVLTVAEAYAKLNMEDSARIYLDKIRLRADATAAASTASGNALLELIYKERRKEFAFEGGRMFDLLRWKKPVTRTDGPTGAESLGFPNDKAIAPIPITDILQSGLTQNPGY